MSTKNDNCALAEAVRTCAVKGLKVEECYMPVTGAKKKVISHWTVVFYWEIYGKIWVIYGKSMFYGAPSCNFHGNFMGLVGNMGTYQFSWLVDVSCCQLMLVDVS